MIFAFLYSSFAPQPVGTAVTTAIVKHPKRKEGHEPDYSYHARGTPGNRERERLADTGGADPAESEPDNLTPDAAVGVLEQHGFLISKARLYKLTAKGDVPFRKYGNKLLFSRRELLSWAESLARRVNDKGEAALAIARSANRKLRSHGK